MTEHFRVSEEGSLHEQFFWVQQDGTVKDYKLRFVKYASPLEISDKFLMAAFVKGLKRRIRSELRIWTHPI